MTNRLVVVSALVLGALGAQPLLAQTAASSPSRAEVKAQVPPPSERMKDQNITGERMPTSDQLPPKPKKKTSAEKKAEKAAKAASAPAK